MGPLYIFKRVSSALLFSGIAVVFFRGIFLKEILESQRALENPAMLNQVPVLKRYFFQPKF